jgi:hypothetical protein
MPQYSYSWLNLISALASGGVTWGAPPDGGHRRPPAHERRRILQRQMYSSTISTTSMGEGLRPAPPSGKWESVVARQTR